MPVSPWAVLFSWEKPSNGHTTEQILITGGLHYEITTHLNEKYQFFFVDKGITPGADLSVALNVYYVSAIRDDSPTGALMEKPGTFCGKNCKKKKLFLFLALLLIVFRLS